MVRGFVLVGAVLAAGAVAASEDPLMIHRWKSRIVVISAPSSTDSYLLQQRARLAAASDGLRERDITVVEAVGDTREAKSLRTRLNLPDAAFRVVLVGKDGAAKRTEARPLPAETLFATVDAMPMRRDEMRR